MSLMEWHELASLDDLNNIITSSDQRAQIIFKHSTRCSISVMAKTRLERAYADDVADFHLLDLLQHRDISNKIAEQFEVHHESPQVLIIKNGSCIYDESHNAIDMESIQDQC